MNAVVEFSPAETFIHPSACVEPGAALGKGVHVGPFCHVGPRRGSATACGWSPTWSSPA